MNLMIRALCSAIALPVLSACSTPPELQFSEGKHHTFAIYNRANLLVTDPVGSLSQVLTDRKCDQCSHQEFTDVFVVSHGWNFTVSEALDNYQNYLLAYERLFHGDRKPPRLFKPYFIFVTWNSISRPISEGVESLLPFGLDQAVHLGTRAVDTVLFHFPSAWKQSLAAATNALGNKYPVRYENQPYKTERVSYRLFDFDSGFDVPVSALIYQLLEMREEGELPANLRFHSVGHSYGSKLIGLATVEALRRWGTEHPLVQAEEGDEESRRPAGDETEGSAGTETEDPKGDQNPPVRPDLIESLVLFNPAMHASEFSYSVEGAVPAFPVRYLDQIPRKAIVYSNFDAATGFLFDISQTVVNNAHAQNGQQFINEYVTTLEGPARYVSGVMLVPLGALQLVYSSVLGLGQWAFRRLYNTPGDWLYHITDYKGFEVLGPARYPLNAIHYFLPLEALWPWANSPADQRGILRHTNPGLGRTGFVRHNLGRVQLFDSEGQVGATSINNAGRLAKYADPDNEVKASEFVRLARKVPATRGEVYRVHDKFYSFDASEIYNSPWVWPAFAGSHGDLRSEDEVMIPVGNCGLSKPLRRIDATIQFVYNFTQTPAPAAFPSTSVETPESDSVSID
jgi:hypothetical protein